MVNRKNYLSIIINFNLSKIIKRLIILDIDNQLIISCDKVMFYVGYRFV